MFNAVIDKKVLLNMELEVLKTVDWDVYGVARAANLVCFFQ